MKQGETMNKVSEIALDNISFIDKRGWLINPTQLPDLDFGVLSNLHLVSLEPNVVRGNHYHPKASEWMIVFGGAAQIAWQDKNDVHLTTLAISADKPVYYFIPNNVLHAVRNVSQSTIYLLVFRDIEDDTIRCPSLFT